MLPSIDAAARFPDDLPRHWLRSAVCNASSLCFALLCGGGGEVCIKRRRRRLLKLRTNGRYQRRYLLQQHQNCNFPSSSSSPTSSSSSSKEGCFPGKCTCRSHRCTLRIIPTQGFYLAGIQNLHSQYLFLTGSGAWEYWVTG